ncbi:hypothetical protein D3C78_722090 [compost metagenome]
MGTSGELVLHFTADTVHAGEHFGGQPHHARSFGNVAAHTRMEIHAVAHRDVTHMFHAADHADLRIAGHDHARRIVQGLHRRSAQAVDGNRRNGVWDFRQQRRVTRNVKTLLQRLLHAAPVNIINRTCFQRRVARQQAPHQVRGEIFGAYVTECATL